MPDYVPAANAHFYWRDGQRELPERFVMIDDRSDRDPITGVARTSVERFDNSAGAHVAGWMQSDGDLGSTPEALFATEFLDRVTERQAIRDGLAAIANIEECEWARRMLRAFDEMERRRA